MQDFALKMRSHTKDHENRGRLEKRIRLSGLTFRGQMPTDGNCLFHAVADQLQRVDSNNKLSHSELRDLAVTCLRDHQFVVSHYQCSSISVGQHVLIKLLMQDSVGQPLDMANFVAGRDWKSYLDNLAQNRTRVDHLAVMALETSLSHDIRIVSSVSGTDDHFDIIIEPMATKHVMRHL